MIGVLRGAVVGKFKKTWAICDSVMKLSHKTHTVHSSGAQLALLYGVKVMIFDRRHLIVSVAAVAFGLAACGKSPEKAAASGASATAAADVNAVVGAGASFPAPLYAKWASDYAGAKGVKVNYQSVGSGAGMKQIEAKTVDFGASDEPLKDEDLKAKGLVQFPTVVGGVIPVVNIAGVKPGELVLDGQTLGDIYLGKIQTWNDAAIKALNPNVNLPGDKISVVRRADGSGTSFIFTNYLSKVNAEWKEKIGEGKAVNWPVGTGGKGNEGVAAFVSRLPNSIGYVEYAYVKQNKMTYAKLKNAAGKVVEPSEASFKAAAAAADWKSSFYQILTNEKAETAWPITAATFIMMHAKQEKADKAAASLKFFDWVLSNGDQTALGLDYVSMPEDVKAIIRASWANVQDASGKPVAYK